MTPVAPAAEPAESATALGLRACERDLDLYLSDAMAVFGTSALGIVHLPRLDASGLARGELRAVASLYQCAQLEKAGLPGFVEALAEKLATGRLVVMMDEGATRLMRYHRGRHERHTAAERRAIYSRLFGGPGFDDPNGAFDGQLLALIQALRPLSGLAPGPAPAHLTTRVAAAGLSLTGGLGGRAAGATRFDAERILAHIQLTIRLLTDADIAGALGGGNPLRLITLHAPHILGEPLDPTPHVRRGVEGAQVLRWLADHLAEVRSGAVPMRTDDPVVNHAWAWEAA
ncbi:MAG: hypothetical protein H6739_22235 [Alphaproteobacteria bacterium]|nr:hypothetical protein [Alphaproteobacteria bacterium]